MLLYEKKLSNFVGLKIKKKVSIPDTGNRPNFEINRFNKNAIRPLILRIREKEKHDKNFKNIYMFYTGLLIWVDMSVDKAIC